MKLPCATPFFLPHPATIRGRPEEYFLGLSQFFV